MSARASRFPLCGRAPGVTGHNVRYVLAFGLIAVVAAFLIVYLVYV
jgi:hypothetical protein